MATRSFLNQTDLIEAHGILQPPLYLPDGDVSVRGHFPCYDFSRWLGFKLEQRLAQFSGWKEADPVVLGSWARGELCPASDIDVIFCGPEDKVRFLVDQISKEGIRLRYRVPEDLSDWQKGVESFDILALLSAHPMSENSARLLRIEQKKILNNEDIFKQKLLKSMQIERMDRAHRHDSMTHVLEPNMKYGPGGLRDLEQARVIFTLYKNSFDRALHAQEVLEYYKAFFLSIRQKLHLLGMTDVLAAQYQSEIATWLGYERVGDFMRELHKGLARVSFYADWIYEYVITSPKKQQQINSLHFTSVKEACRALEENSSLLVQYQVRLSLTHIFKNELRAQERYKLIKRILDYATEESTLTAFFRSLLFVHLIPEMLKLEGYIQHDQYHRYTVNAHTLQGLKELKRLFNRPQSSGQFSSLVKGLKKKDWDVLAWSILYHDLGKGSGREHEKKSYDIVRKELREFAVGVEFLEEVSWLVLNHLQLFSAAYRQNPHAPLTWKKLFDRGLTAGRLKRLAVFTMIDIKATNPDAWNEWKESILFTLVKKLESTQASEILDFVEKSEKLDLAISEKFLDSLESELLSGISSLKLSKDLVSARKSKESLLPLVLQNRKKDIWIRFHSKSDRAGLLLEFVRKLYQIGVNVQFASVQTYDDIGVYDWFKVKSKMKTNLIRKLLCSSFTEMKPLPEVGFDNISVVSQDEEEVILSFKGKDRAGLLALAAQALYEHGAEIRWAKAHNWGLQVDDLFSLKPVNEPEMLVKKLRARLLVKES